MKKILSIFCLVIAFAILLCSTVSAGSSTSFTHVDEPDGTLSTVLSREMYTADSYITASSLGLEDSFEGISDVCFGPGGEIYVLCDTSKLIKINPDYTFNKLCTITDKEGKAVDFAGAKGVYVDTNGDIYIADTANARIIIANNEGAVADTWNLPESDLIPEDFVYQPVSVTRDEQGYTYILSQGCYYGAMTYSPEGVFKGFYGANTVEATVLDTMQFLWDKLTSNDTKKAASVKKLPYSFVDFTLDTDGYMVICTGTTESTTNGMGQIRKISPGGTDILYSNDKTGSTKVSSSINFLEDEVVKKNIVPQPQNIVSIDVDDAGFIYALDRTFGLIYVYDDSCTLLGALGGGFGLGDKVGVFEVPISLAVNNNSILVIDSSREAITVFNTTEYGKLLKTAQTMYLDGRYSDAEPYWKQVNALDKGNPLAYRGLAMVEYYNGDLDKALDYAKKGLDYTVYDLAYQTVFKNNIKKFFPLIAACVVVLFAGIIVAAKIIKKRNIVLIKSQALRTALCAVVHPFDSFNNVKYKKQGSIAIATAFLGLFFLTGALNDVASGFLFSSYSPQSYNILYTLAKTVVLVGLWAIANWLVCALFSGKGTLKEIYIVSCYSLLPLIVYNAVRFVLSYILPLSGVAFTEGLYTAVLIFTFFILSVAMMTVHEYGFGKFIGTGLITVFGMLLVVFIAFMIIVQLQQFGIFISSIFMEVVYR